MAIDKTYIVAYNEFVKMITQDIVYQISTHFSYKTILEKTADGKQFPSVVLCFYSVLLFIIPEFSVKTSVLQSLRNVL